VNTLGEKPRTDLIGQTGSYTRTFTIIDATEGKYGVDIRVTDNMGNTFWTTLDDDISLD
jgi:hypothetical protein